MILDPDNKYIQKIHSHAPLTGATVLDVGCGDGKISRNIAEYASRVVATDSNATVLEQAKQKNHARNIEFLYTPDGIPDLAAHSFDLVLYTLSLHHIPKDKMVANLSHSGHLLKDNGKIIIIEPSDTGSFMAIKKRFGAGSGDESQERLQAVDAMKNLAGWTLSLDYHFDVVFQFTDENDFFAHKLPNYQTLPTAELAELKQFLKRSSTDQGIILTTGRRLNILTRSEPLKKGK
ncbi:Methyltransferase domain-containing protein [Desulfuromusa kysingii]|uniref:Methyltransferase domain-containing protein n=1 Tax=Desulfuromusa kysingii TaxID=37625 RepID=A0A1H3WVP6_9BACT|nr:class I SAM-dependent methyltransferase [Desulfuromusa kysingii]SDZ91209.1 Methyltransferase domain-containing protein [Desulfuromusa kysingii]